MAFAVELFFDPVTDEEIRTIWDRLSEAGVSSGMTEIDARPHITLSVGEWVDADEFKEHLEQFAKQSRKLPVTLQSYGIFPKADGVVFAAPIVTHALLDLHKQFHETAGQHLLKPEDLYKPGAWVPHCTLATDLTPALLTAAIGVCQRSPLPLHGTLDTIGLVEFMPVDYHYAFPLGE